MGDRRQPDRPGHRGPPSRWREGERGASWRLTTHWRKRSVPVFPRSRLSPPAPALELELDQLSPTAHPWRTPRRTAVLLGWLVIALSVGVGASLLAAGGTSQEVSEAQLGLRLTSLATTTQPVAAGQRRVATGTFFGDPWFVSGTDSLNTPGSSSVWAFSPWAGALLGMRDTLAGDPHSDAMVGTFCLAVAPPCSQRRPPIPRRHDELDGHKTDRPSTRRNFCRRLGPAGTPGQRQLLRALARTPARTLRRTLSRQRDLQPVDTFWTDINRHQLIHDDSGQGRRGDARVRPCAADTDSLIFPCPARGAFRPMPPRRRLRLAWGAFSAGQTGHKGEQIEPEQPALPLASKASTLLPLLAKRTDPPPRATRVVRRHGILERCNRFTRLSAVARKS